MDTVFVFIHHIVVAHHLRVGGQRATRHGRPRNHWLYRLGFRRHHVVRHAVLEDGFGMHHLVDVDIELVVFAAQCVPQGGHVGLAGAAGCRSHGAVDLIRAGLDGGEVADGADTGGLMGVENDLGITRQHLTSHGDGFVDLLWNGGTGRILKADAIERNARIENILEGLLVELDGVGPFASGRQLHHGHADFVLQTMIGDGPAGVDQVVGVVEGVKVSDGGDPVFLEHLGVKIDDVARLGIQSHYVDPAGEGLELGVGTGRYTELVHHVEGRFVAVEERSLEARAAARFKMGLSGFNAGLNGRQEIFGEYASAVNGLEAVAERGVHDMDGFLSHCFSPN
jgi:hypothetical protein